MNVLKPVFIPRHKSINKKINKYNVILVFVTKSSVVCNCQYQQFFNKNKDYQTEYFGVVTLPMSSKDIASDETLDWICKDPS